MGMKKTRIETGFSLIEVMISMLVLLVGVMGLAVAFQRNIYQTNSSKNDTQAMLLAYAIVDESAPLPKTHAVRDEAYRFPHFA